MLYIAFASLGALRASRVNAMRPGRFKKADSFHGFDDFDACGQKCHQALLRSGQTNRTQWSRWDVDSLSLYLQ